VKTLILSYRHHLAPLAWRLSREEVPVELVVTKKRYQKAWDGRLEKAVRGEDLPLDHPDLKPWVEAALVGESRVLTDLTSVLHSDLGGSTHLFFTLKTPPPTQENYSLVLGTWFNGTDWKLLHWYVPDWGLFPGGMGAHVMAGGTVLHGSTYPVGLLEPLREPLMEAGFRGLVGLGLRYVESSGQLEPTGYFHAGWDDWLHWELAMCELPSWASLLEDSPQPDDLPPFTVGVVVSQPPWPAVGHPVPPRVELHLQPQVTKGIFFHDICVEDGRVYTAGCDGLVGVARGSAKSLPRAKAKALATADALTLSERQLRPDVGGNVDLVVSGLEELGLW